MRKLRIALVLGAALALATTTLVGAAAPSATTSGGTVTATTGANVDTSVALVQLNGDPLSTYVKTKPARGKKVDFNSNTVKAYRAQLSGLRNDFKKWLMTNAPKAKVTGSWDLALNAVAVQLNGTTLAKLASAPQVKHVEYEGLYHPTVDDPDLTLISAQAAWARTSVGGPEGAGAGVKVAILDTGIDISHPCFWDDGYTAPDGFPKGDPGLTNNKVIVAKVFFNKNASRQYTAEAIQEHGTHVAGTVACNFGTPATVNGATIPYDMSGVAPAAYLGNYNIFPNHEGNARSEDILNALEAAYVDGMDVANMSLGGGASGIQDLLTMAVDDLDVANMVVAVAAGNEGEGSDAGAHPYFPPGHFTVSSPGSAARALTAGAITVGHQVLSLVEQDGNQYFTSDGDFAFPTTDFTAATVETTSGSPLVLVNNDPSHPLNGHYDGCGAYAPTSLTGKIVLVSRGVCTFTTKVANAQAAGAAAVIIVNRDATPIPMANSDDTLTIPVVMVGLADGFILLVNAPMVATITAPIYVSQDDPATDQFAPGTSWQSSFSSQGPTDVDFRIKPDVMAPGENVLSSIPTSFCGGDPCFAFFAGTSMATPHLAGSAAVLIAEHDWLWDAWEVRSAIVNTADQGYVLGPTGSGDVTDVNIVGAGRENLDKAVTAWVTLNPVSVSFGAVPSGAGGSASYTVTIKNEHGSWYDYGLNISGGTGGGVSFSLATNHIELAAGATGTFTVTMTWIKGATFGGHQAQVNVTGTVATYAHLMLFTLVK